MTYKTGVTEAGVLLRRIGPVPTNMSAILEVLSDITIGTTDTITPFHSGAEGYKPLRNSYRWFITPSTGLVLLFSGVRTRNLYRSEVFSRCAE